MFNQVNKGHFHHYLFKPLTNDHLHILFLRPRIGQGRARLRRKVKTLQPISLPHQLPAQPITKHVPKTVMPLPEPTNQSQSHVQPQIMPRVLSQHQPVDPTCIIQQIGPKIQHRLSPPYNGLYARPPPKPPDIIDPSDSQKDLLDNDSDRKVERGKFSISGRYNLRDLCGTQHFICTRTSGINRSNRHHQIYPKILTKTDRH